MSRTRHAWVALATLIVGACDYSFENVPRVTPARESLWMLVGLQMKLDGTRADLVQSPSKSVSPARIERGHERGTFVSREI